MDGSTIDQALPSLWVTMVSSLASPSDEILAVLIANADTDDAAMKEGADAAETT